MAKKPQKRRKSSLRTAPQALQDQYQARIAALVADPTVLLPEVIGPEPKAVAKIRKRLAKMTARGKPGLGDRRDKGIVGAVAHCHDIAAQENVTRLLDHRVAGARRFYLQRGHVTRAITLGVQNYDDPRVLMMAWGELAKENDWHLFGGTRLRLATKPEVPTEWVDELADKTGVALHADDDGWSDDTPAGDPTVVIRIRGGPRFRIGAASGRKSGGFHAAMAARYRGKGTRQPFDVTIVAADGTEVDPHRETLAGLRAGVATEADLLQKSGA